jgi:hypothetical protein
MSIDKTSSSNKDKLFKTIDLMSDADTIIVLNYCQERLNKIKQNKLETKLIDILKTKYAKYPDLLLFADGIRINKYSREEADYMIFCNFSLEICNSSKYCSKKTCSHLRIDGGGTYDKESPNVDAIEYSITSQAIIDSADKHKYYTSHFCDYDIGCKIETDAISRITTKFNFDSATNSVLNGFFKDILGMIL